MAKNLGFWKLNGIEVRAELMDAKDLDFQIECDHCGKQIKGKYVSACDRFNCEGIWGKTCFEKNAISIVGYSDETFFDTY